MTTRRLNYTGCKRIRRADVDIAVDGEEVPSRFIWSPSLEGYDFPRNARVVVEAQAHWTLMRFDCGTVGQPSVERSYELLDFGSPDGIVFRLKVISSGNEEGLILGEADGIRPAQMEGRGDAESFLAVEPADLGQVAWRLSFAGPEPLLQINERLGDWRSFMRRPEVRSLLVPELWRQLLREALRNPADSEASDAWQNIALDQAPTGAGPRPTSDDEEQIVSWVDDAVRLIAGRHRLLRGFAHWSEGDQ